MVLSVRNLCSWVLAKALISLGFVRKAKLKALNGEHILSLYFHNPSKREFEACIKWLIKQNFTFLSVKDLECIIHGVMPFPKGGILLTVDDGWGSNETNIVEVAAKYEIPVAIFVSTQPVEEGTYWWSHLESSTTWDNSKQIEALKKVPDGERLAVVNEIRKEYELPREAMTIEQLCKISLSSVVTIGGHTHSHPILTNCDDLQVYHEIDISKQKLELWMNKEVTFFAYPNGDYGIREVQALKDLGYKLAFSNVPDYLTKLKLMHAFELPRIGLLEGASLAENICRMVGVWHPTIKNIKKLFKQDTSHVDKPVNHKIEKADISILK